jgi:hypothetical protein
LPQDFQLRMAAAGILFPNYRNEMWIFVIKSSKKIHHSEKYETLTCHVRILKGTSSWFIFTGDIDDFIFGFGQALGPSGRDGADVGGGDAGLGADGDRSADGSGGRESR